MDSVKSITPYRITSAYIFCAALEPQTRAARPRHSCFGERYAVVRFLSRRAQGACARHHLVASAWLVLVVLAVLVVVFA